MIGKTNAVVGGGDEDLIVLNAYNDLAVCSIPMYTVGSSSKDVYCGMGFISDRSESNHGTTTVVLSAGGLANSSEYSSYGRYIRFIDGLLMFSYGGSDANTLMAYRAYTKTNALTAYQISAYNPTGSVSLNRMYKVKKDGTYSSIGHYRIRNAGMSMIYGRTNGMMSGTDDIWYADVEINNGSYTIESIHKRDGSVVDVATTIANTAYYSLSKVNLYYIPEYSTFEVLD